MKVDVDNEIIRCRTNPPISVHWRLIVCIDSFTNRFIILFSHAISSYQLYG